MSRIKDSLLRDLRPLRDIRHLPDLWFIEHGLPYDLIVSIKHSIKEFLKYEAELEQDDHHPQGPIAMAGVTSWSQSVPVGTLPFYDKTRASQASSLQIPTILCIPN
jgi:hypothetical protein